VRIIYIKSDRKEIFCEDQCGSNLLGFLISAGIVLSGVKDSELLELVSKLCLRELRC
jgi:hypothetical protein